MEQVKNQQSSSAESDPTLRWLRIIAVLTGLIGLAGFIALANPSAWAQNPPGARGGFPSGSRTFSNPFANTNNQPPAAQNAGGSGDQFFDDDEDNSDDSGGAPSGGGGNTAAAGGGRGGQPAGGISVGGGPPSGVIEKNKPAELKIDNETGAGSKEIVTDFNFPDADILDIAKALGKLTGKNFILDKDVKGRITIISNSPITVGDAWKAFLTALDINGFALIPSGKYIRIARQRDARDKQLKTYTGEYSPDTDALITRVFPLKYINAEEVARTFRSFMPANSRIIPYEQTNTVIVTDTGSNIAKLSKMLELLDVEGYDAGIEVIPVKFASAGSLSDLIDKLLPGTGGPGGAPAGAPRFGGSRFSARRTKEGGIINTIIADERTNTLIVHANTKGADQVRELVAKLDQKIPSTAGGKVHVVYLQFAEAEQIANTLNNLGSGAARPAAPAGGGTGVNPVATSLFEGSIKVSPDKSTNSLVVTASPADFSTVQRVINRLDIPRDEVFVEVVIMEVQLNNDFEFSTGAKGGPAFFDPKGDLAGFLANPVGQTGAIFGFSRGSTPVTFGSQTFNVPNTAALIRTIQTNSKGNVLATPQIIALDNAEATFDSTENIPVPVSTQVQGVGNSITFSKLPITLSIVIKPQINKMSNFVKMDVQTKLGDVSDRAPPRAIADQAIATLDRTVKTTVVVGDSDTVVIGGLIRDKTSVTVSKVPVLGDIPLLGWLFRGKKESSAKSNLLVFLTPHIVRQYDKVRAILDKKLKERDDFIEQYAGGQDPARPTRDEIIRNLPNINDLKAKPQTTVPLDEDQATPTTPNENGTNPFSGSGNGAANTPQAKPGVPELGTGVPEAGMPPQAAPPPDFTPPPPPVETPQD